MNARRGLAPLAVLLAFTATARADPGVAASLADTPASARADITLGVHGGFTDAPFATIDQPTTTGHGFVFIGEGRVRLEAGMLVGLSASFALVNIRQPAGSYAPEAAFGNPQLFAERLVLARDGLVGRVRLAIGIPIAPHDSPGNMKNRALAICDALVGWRDRGAFVPGFLPITPSGELAKTWGMWTASALVTLPVLVRVSDADLAMAEHRAGFTPVIGAALHARVMPTFETGLAAYAAIEVARPIEWQRDPSRLQLVLQPSFAWRWRDHTRVTGDITIPIAGPLGGDTLATSLAISRDF